MAACSKLAGGILRYVRHLATDSSASPHKEKKNAAIDSVRVSAGSFFPTTSSLKMKISGEDESGKDGKHLEWLLWTDS